MTWDSGVLQPVALLVCRFTITLVHPISLEPGAWGLEGKEQEEMEGSLWEIFWARYASGIITSTCVPSVEMWSGGLI